jgi:hypothetical protein
MARAGAFFARNGYLHQSRWIRARGGYRHVDVREVLRYPVAKLEAPAYRLEIIDGAERRPGEEPFARPRAVILWTLLEPLLVYGIGFRGQDDLAAGAKILQGRQGDLVGLCTRFRENFNGGVERFDLFGIAGNIPGVEMPDDTDSQISENIHPNPPSLSICRFFYCVLHIIPILFNRFGCFVPAP